MSTHFLRVAIKTALIKQTSKNPNVETVGDTGLAPSFHPGTQTAASARLDPGVEAIGEAMGSLS